MDKVRVARIACLVKMVLVGCAGHAEDSVEQAPEMAPVVGAPAVCVLDGAYRVQQYRDGVLQSERTEFLKRVPCEIESTVCVGEPPCNHIVCQAGDPSPGCTTTSGVFVLDRQRL